MEFSADNPQHVAELAKMGIQIQILGDGRKYPKTKICISISLCLDVQLVHISSSAESIDDAENGLLFMQEMIEFMKNTNSLDTSQINHLPLTVIPLTMTSFDKPIKFIVSTAQFGKQLHGSQGVSISYLFKNDLLFML